MYNKAVDTSPSVIQYVPENYNIQKMYGKAIDNCSFEFNSVSDRYKTQEMCDKNVSKDPFMLKYCLD